MTSNQTRPVVAAAVRLTRVEGAEPLLAPSNPYPPPTASIVRVVRQHEIATSPEPRMSDTFELAPNEAIRWTVAISPCDPFKGYTLLCFDDIGLIEDYLYALDRTSMTVYIANNSVQPRKIKIVW